MVSLLTTQTRVDFEAPLTDASLGIAAAAGDEELVSIDADAEGDDSSTLGASEGVATDDALLVGDASMGAAERSTLEQPASRSTLNVTARAPGSLDIGLPFIKRDETFQG